MPWYVYLLQFVQRSAARECCRANIEAPHKIGSIDPRLIMARTATMDSKWLSVIARFGATGRNDGPLFGCGAKALYSSVAECVGRRDPIPSGDGATLKDLSD